MRRPTDVEFAVDILFVVHVRSTFSLKKNKTKELRNRERAVRGLTAGFGGKVECAWWCALSACPKREGAMIQWTI